VFNEGEVNNQKKCVQKTEKNIHGMMRTKKENKPSWKVKRISYFEFLMKA
jgi:hypothetical protein